MKKVPKKKEGFTLIELLIVVAIIGIIAGIAIPNFLGARSKARVTRAFADMRAIADALEMYYVDNTTYPAALLADLTPTHITSLPNDPFGTDEVPGYRYYANAASTAWLLVSNGPDGVADVTPAAAAFTNLVSGQLGGADGATGLHYGSEDWSDGSAGSTGDLGRGGP